MPAAFRFLGILNLGPALTRLDDVYTGFLSLGTEIRVFHANLSRYYTVVVWIPRFLEAKPILAKIDRHIGDLNMNCVAKEQRQEPWNNSGLLYSCSMAVS